MAGLNLTGRLKALEKVRPALRDVYVQAVEPWERGHEPGDITPWPNGRGHTLFVPWEHAAAPLDGLSDRQREWLRPGDEILQIGLPVVNGQKTTLRRACPGTRRLDDGQGR